MATSSKFRGLEYLDGLFFTQEAFGKDGGFVFSVVHNIQDNVDLKNVQRILDVLKEYR